MALQGHELLVKPSLPLMTTSIVEVDVDDASEHMKMHSLTPMCLACEAIKPHMCTKHCHCFTVNLYDLFLILLFYSTFRIIINEFDIGFTL